MSVTDELLQSDERYAADFTRATCPCLPDAMTSGPGGQ